VNFNKFTRESIDHKRGNSPWMISFVSAGPGQWMLSFAGKPDTLLIGLWVFVDNQEANSLL